MSSKYKSPKHFKEELRASLITDEWAEKCGIYELNDKNEVARLLNRHPSKTPKGPFVVYPYFDIEDRNLVLTVNVKAAEPLMVEGKEQKYLRPNGSTNHLYVPKFISLVDLLNNKNPILFTEGEKKTICANIHGFLTIGLNGVQNWRTKDEEGVSRPLEVFNKLNLSGRQVLICFDSDVMTNEDVQRAENDFSKYLQSLGAKVRVLRFHDNTSDEKVAIDDYILEHGVEEFRKLAKEAVLPVNTSTEDIEAYLSGLKGLSTEEKHNKIKTASHAIAAKDSVVSDILIKNIAANSGGVNIDTVREIIGAIKKKKVNSKLTKTSNVIVHESERPLKPFVQAIINKLIDNGSFYREGNELIQAQSHKRNYLSKESLPGVFLEFCELKVDGKYRPMENGIAQAILYNGMKKDVPEIALFTTTPTYCPKTWSLTQPGYNKDSKILYLPDPNIKNLKPKKSQKLIDEMFADFCFKNEASKANARGALLTALIPHMFQGGKSFFANTGNQPGLGKSLLAEIISILVSGTESYPIGYTPDEYQMEHLILTAIQSTNILNFDNIKANKELSSGPLERFITSANPAGRRMGRNDELIVKPNTFVVFISINDAMFGKDLLSRMCPIEFWWDKDPSDRTYSKPDLKQWVRENRKGILEEVIGMFEVWKEKGCPLASIQSRFTQWPATIGGILEANGIKGFMDNYKGATTTYTQVARETGDLFAENLNKWLKVSDLVSIAKNANCFKDIMAKANPNVALGIALTKLAEAKTPIPLHDGTTFILKRSESTDSEDRKAIYFADAPQHMEKNKKGKSHE
jgi:hypothetical protein